MGKKAKASSNPASKPTTKENLHDGDFQISASISSSKHFSLPH
jgi:hypothetical protein